MKRRQGFVSNSSSSSFIIGIGKVDEDKVEQAKAWAKNDWDVELCLATRDGYVEEESFTYATVSVEVKEGDYYLKAYVCEDVDCDEDGDIIEPTEDELNWTTIDNMEDFCSNVETSVGFGRNG